MQLFKPKGAAFAGLTCALVGATLAGCNNGTSGTGVAGAASGNSSDTLATVGGAKISRADLGAFLETQYGRQALPYLIDNQLIFENLKAKGLDVTDAEVDADLARRQAQDPTLAPLIAAGGSALQDAKAQLKRQLAIQKLLTNDIKPTDAQLKTFFNENSRYYGQPAKVKLGLLFASSKVRADLMASQLKAGTKTFEALVAEQKKVKDPLAAGSTANRGSFESLDNFSPAIAAQLQKLPKGGTTAAQQVNIGQPKPAFMIFKKVDVQPATKGDFTALRAQVETDYKLAQIARKINAQNPNNPSFPVTLQRTQRALQQQSPTGQAPELRDVLNFINQNAVIALMSSLRSAGTVQVSDPTYATVAQAYQAMGAPSGLPGGAPSGLPGGALGTASNSAPAANAASAANAAPAPR